MKRNSIEWLIWDGLGYCCEWKFFSLYHDCEVIAARLGVTSRAVRNHKARFEAGELCCEHRPDCLAVKLHPKPNLPVAKDDK